MGTVTGTGTGGTGTGTGGITGSAPSAVVSSDFNRQYLLTLSSSWEADGASSAATSAATWPCCCKAKPIRRAVQTRLLANIANDYCLLLAYDAQLPITRQTVVIRTKDVETTKLFKNAAIVTGGAVDQSEANLYAAQVTISDLERNVRETENALSILLNRPPGIVECNTFDAQTQPALLQTGVPGQVLRNRLDVQEAEASYRFYL